MIPQGWHPVALAQDIVAGTSAGAVLAGHEIALWRDTAGAIHAWEDRCPHRGMKLSFGFVRGDHIACLYHGWEYGSDGRCRKIPAHPALEVPASICVKTYGVAEVAGMVLVALDPVPPVLPSVPLVTTAIRSLFLDCPLDRAVQLLASGRAFSAPFRIAGTFATQGDSGLFIGLHDIGPSGSALHIAVAGQITAEERIAFSDQAIAFRQLVETVRA